MNLKKYRHIALVAVSGTGKGSVLKQLALLVPELRTSISCTTRSPRNGEKDGIHYFFISREQFIEKKEAGEFAEWFEYNGNFYGTLFSEIEKRERNNQPIAFDVEINGFVMLKKSLGDKLLGVFLDCPIEESEKRLRKRGTESEEYIQQRLKIGIEEEIPRKHECDEIAWYGEGADPSLTANYIANLMLVQK